MFFWLCSLRKNDVTAKPLGSLVLRILPWITKILYPNTTGAQPPSSTFVSVTLVQDLTLWWEWADALVLELSVCICTPPLKKKNSQWGALVLNPDTVFYRENFTVQLTEPSLSNVIYSFQKLSSWKTPPQDSVHLLLLGWWPMSKWGGERDSEYSESVATDESVAPYNNFPRAFTGGLWLRPGLKIQISLTPEGADGAARGECHFLCRICPWVVLHRASHLTGIMPLHVFRPCPNWSSIYDQ